MDDLRSNVLPVHDYEFLSWPLWGGDVLRLPKMQFLEKNNIIMVADVLNQIWNILSKQEIEEQKGVDLKV